MFKHIGLFLALVAVLFLAAPVVDVMAQDDKAKEEQGEAKGKCENCEKGKEKCEDCAKKCDDCEKDKKCDGCKEKSEGKGKGGCKKGE